MKPPVPRAERESSITRDTTEFSFASVALYADKLEYVEKGLVFTVPSVEHQAGRGFEEGTDRWAVVAELEDRPNEILTFSCNEKRDEQMRAAQAYIEAHGPIPNVRLKKSGRAYYLETVVGAQTP